MTWGWWLLRKCYGEYSSCVLCYRHQSIKHKQVRYIYKDMCRLCLEKNESVRQVCCENNLNRFMPVLEIRYVTVLDGTVPLSILDAGHKWSDRNANSNITYPCVFFSLSIYDHKWFLWFCGHQGTTKNDNRLCFSWGKTCPTGEACGRRVYETATLLKSCA